MATQTDPAAVLAVPGCGEESPERVHPAALPEAIVAAVVASARVAPGMTALDLGGSRGDLAIPLARAIGASGHVTAIDPAGSLLAVAATRAGWLGLTNLTFRVAEPHDLPFPDGAFDRVTGWIDPILGAGVGPVLGESWRVLKPGGRLVIAALGAAPARLAEEFRRADFTGIEETRLASVEIASGCRAGGRR